MTRRFTSPSRGSCGSKEVVLAPSVVSVVRKTAQIGRLKLCLVSMISAFKIKSGRVDYQMQLSSCSMARIYPSSQVLRFCPPQVSRSPLSKSQRRVRKNRMKRKELTTRAAVTNYKATSTTVSRIAALGFPIRLAAPTTTPRRR